MSSPIHKKLLPRKVQVKSESPKNVVVISKEDVSPKVLLTAQQIRESICELYFREESKSYYQQRMLEASTRRFKSGKHQGEKYSDVLKSDPKYIMYLLKLDNIKPFELRDYCILSMPVFYFR
jgi:hypothetical protein